MTTPSERTRAVLQTRKFLHWVLNSEEVIPEVFRSEARALLRHYPSSIDVQLAHLACLMWWGASLERRAPMPPDDVERLISDLDAGIYDPQTRIAQAVGPAPPQRFSDVKQFDVRAWAKRKGIKLSKR